MNTIMADMVSADRKLALLVDAKASISSGRETFICNAIDRSLIQDLVAKLYLRSYIYEALDHCSCCESWLHAFHEGDLLE